MFEHPIFENILKSKIVRVGKTSEQNLFLTDRSKVVFKGSPSLILTDIRLEQVAIDLDAREVHVSVSIPGNLPEVSVVFKPDSLMVQDWFNNDWVIKDLTADQINSDLSKVWLDRNALEPLVAAVEVYLLTENFFLAARDLEKYVKWCFLRNISQEIMDYRLFNAERPRIINLEESEVLAGDSRKSPEEMMKIVHDLLFGANSTLFSGLESMKVEFTRTSDGVVSIDSSFYVNHGGINNGR